MNWNTQQTISGEFEQKYYNTQQLAFMLGVCPRTLARYERSGKIKTVPRNYRNHRVYTMEDFREIRKQLNRLYYAK